MLFQNYVFVTDQFGMTIKAFNTSGQMRLIKTLDNVLALPYDIIMYDGSVQKDGPGKRWVMDGWVDG